MFLTGSMMNCFSNLVKGWKWNLCPEKCVSHFCIQYQGFMERLKFTLIPKLRILIPVGPYN